MSFWEPKQAEETAKAFADALGNNNDMFLGLEIDLYQKEDKITQLISELKKQGWPKIYLWDKNCNEKLLASGQFGNGGLPKPFYKDFSYGGAVNKLLILANMTNCDYLVRVDPGTRPPYYFKQLVDSHIELLKDKKKDKKKDEEKLYAVSGQYTERIGLRDRPVPLDKRESYYSLIQQYTGIDPRRNKQLTGGAAFTISVTGPPLISFDEARAWGSDDGFYQAYFLNKSKVIPESQITRETEGIVMADFTYFVRIANMVVLHGLNKGVNISDATEIALEFLEKLIIHMNSECNQQYDVFDIKKSFADVKAFSSKIYEGYNNYKQLVAKWDDVLEKVEEIVNESDIKLNLENK